METYTKINTLYKRDKDTNKIIVGDYSNKEIEYLKNCQFECTEKIDGTNIKKLEKVVGEIATITAICYLLNRFNASFNVGKSLTQQQSALLASDIVEKYPYETIEDVVLMLKQVRQGIIGDGKDFKLDGQNVLVKWFPEYLDRKYDELERIKKQESQSNSYNAKTMNHMPVFGQNLLHHMQKIILDLTYLWHQSKTIYSIELNLS